MRSKYRYLKLLFYKTKDAAFKANEKKMILYLENIKLKYGME